MRTSALFLLTLALCICAPSAHAQASTQPVRPAATPSLAADSAAIRRAALDYIEGWFTGDAERMRRALHPDLAKRAIDVDRQGRQWLFGSTADGLIRATAAGMGTDIPEARRWSHVEVMDIDGNLASVKVSSTRLVDYMHLVRWDGEWKIVNVLWDMRPENRPRP